MAVLWGGFCGFVDLIGARGPREPDVAVLGGDLAGWAREITPGSAYAAAIAWISGRISIHCKPRVDLTGYQVALYPFPVAYLRKIRPIHQHFVAPTREQIRELPQKAAN